MKVARAYIALTKLPSPQPSPGVPGEGARSICNCPDGFAAGL